MPVKQVPRSVTQRETYRTAVTTQALGRTAAWTRITVDSSAEAGADAVDVRADTSVPPSAGCCRVHAASEHGRVCNLPCHQ